MKVRVFISGPSLCFRDGKEETAEPRYVDIEGDTLNWKVEKTLEHAVSLTVVNESERRDEAYFTPGSWSYVTILPEPEEDEDSGQSYVD